ncbi:hypothetical protein BCV72DRAFT_226992 [Rhizopus microsporus var. microsporus]|uniref:Uncharacterized protein n=2 Tax=Rhizopus microsporus TaxID=58291 RepID=A0A2G4T1K7_RHIZD|nr:uncharacterized protein RHIMIDRAFT_276585 [Rhizopus microsporus ATCC 52813]ORE07266.1 hypothetical protein BCV72DRAFT_226992 [Rhizopus microsporus var. microsporus]PHZ14892.1 hypothetical protein RHIMIDRAFT_276585 [Rhizopus microsporus ATCC 52813]
MHNVFLFMKAICKKKRTFIIEKALCEGILRIRYGYVTAMLQLCYSYIMATLRIPEELLIG